MEASKIKIGYTLLHKGEIITVLGISPHCGDYAINCEKIQKRKSISLDGVETIIEEILPTWVYLKNCNYPLT